MWTDPLVITTFIVGAILALSLALPPDTWDRIRDALWRAPSDGEIIPPEAPKWSFKDLEKP